MAKKPDQKVSADLSQKAFMGIRQMMFHNEIVAGQKIPFRDLADEMDMSVTPIIQALKFLEFQGLVRREPNKGYFIEPLMMEEVEEVFKFRELLELSLLEETIAKLDTKGVETLQTAHQAYLDSLEGVFINKKILADMNFHITIAGLSGQKLRVHALQNVFDLLHLKYKASLQYVTSSRSNEADHGNILNAILDRDLEKSRALLFEHINNSRIHACLNLSRMIEEKAEFQF